MNLCILISSLNIGGAEKQAVSDANLLCSKNNVLLVVFKDGLLKTNLDERIKYIVIDKSGYYNTAKDIATLIVTYKIDVIHASLFAPMIIGALASKISQKPIFWNFHSHEHDLPIKSRLVLFALSRSSLLKRISYVNNELRVFLEKKLWIPKSKGVVLYNNSEFETNTIFTKKNNERLIIGYVGRIVELKRVGYFIDVAQFLIQRKIFNFSIHIVGDGDMRLVIEKRISEMRMDSYFVFHGFQTDLEYFYNYFDVFINPSREECLSIALIDAGMKGIPSIAFDVGGNDEIIVHNESGYIVKCREELFLSLYRLINQPELRNTMGAKAAVHCKNMFSKQERLIKLNMLFDFDER
jgi:glycosyltransferase involved in cell wall biosynthesis